MSSTRHEKTTEYESASTAPADFAAPVDSAPAADSAVSDSTSPADTVVPAGPTPPADFAMSVDTDPPDDFAASDSVSPAGAASFADSVDAGDPEINADTKPNASGKSRFSQADIFKFVGLLAFFAIMVAICFLIWPLVKEIFEPGGVERVIHQVREAGPAGVFFLLAIQFLQVVVAFIPGEVVQVAAGMMYGPWLGALIVFIGCVISSAFIFFIVHKLGAPFVQDMVSTEHLEKFRKFEASGKLNIIVFILFLIPGLPKDVFTYLVPLTDMRIGTFLLLSNVGRIPGIVVSTYAASEFIEGDIVSSIVVFAIAAVVAIIGLICYTRIMKRKEEYHSQITEEHSPHNSEE